jgi:hypothetical protein
MKRGSTCMRTGVTWFAKTRTKYIEQKEGDRNKRYES